MRSVRTLGSRGVAEPHTKIFVSDRHPLNAAHDGTPFPRGVAVFYYFRIEDQVPENRLLRPIDRHVNFEFIRAKLKDSYSDAGRPSIDLELLLCMLLVGYLYGVTSERKLVEGLRMHLAWRWFTGLDFDQEVPHHSTFSKNRHGRFQESNLFQELFEEMVACCVAAGLVKGEHMSVTAVSFRPMRIITAVFPANNWRKWLR